MDPHLDALGPPSKDTTKFCLISWKMLRKFETILGFVEEIY